MSFHEGCPLTDNGVMGRKDIDLVERTAAMMVAAEQIIGIAAAENLASPGFLKCLAGAVAANMDATAEDIGTSPDSSVEKNFQRCKARIQAGECEIFQ